MGRKLGNHQTFQLTPKLDYNYIDNIIGEMSCSDELREKIRRLREIVYFSIENYIQDSNTGQLSWLHGNSGYTRAVNCLLLISCPLAINNQVAFMLVLWGMIHSDISTLLLSQLIGRINQDPSFEKELIIIRPQYGLYEAEVKESKIAKHLINQYIVDLVEFDKQYQPLISKLTHRNSECIPMIDLINLINKGNFDPYRYSYRSLILQQLLTDR